MQQIFPDQLPPEPEFYLERIKKPGSMPAPEGGFPRFEGYEVVSVKIREATITATNDPHAAPFVQTTEAYVYDAPPPHVDVMPSPRVELTPPPPPPMPQPQWNPYAYQSGPVQQPVVTPGMPLVTAKPRKRLLGRDLAMWICVAQLAVIIWWLIGQSTQQRGSVMFTTASTLPTIFGKAFDSAKANVIAHVPHVGSAASVKKPPKGGKKPYARSGGIGKGFIPPPPPELASNSRLLVPPPPPVAYKMPAGAAAASTLSIPAPPVQHHAPVVAHHEEVLTPNTVPSAPLPPPRFEETHAASAATAAATEEEPVGESIPLPVPDWVQQSPSYAWHEAMNGGAPQQARMVIKHNRKQTLIDR